MLCAVPACKIPRPGAPWLFTVFIANHCGTVCCGSTLTAICTSPPLLGGFLLESVSCLPWPDVITAVPQHPDHLRHRGYNQAHELAKVLHNYTGVPLATQLLTRPVPGKEQARLGARARRSNVQHSFNASAEANGLHVWLVDDVMTTGSTMAAATKAMLGGGVTRVDAVFVARTPRNTPN